MVWYDTAQLQKIDDARDEGDWFTAIVLSTTQLERHGSLEIRNYLEELKVKPLIIEYILKRLYLRQIAGYLLTLEKIEKKEHDTIIKLNDERNYFVHRQEKEEFKHSKEAKMKYISLVNEAERILKEKLNVKKLFISKR